MSNLRLDAHGQPADPHINFRNRLDRGIHEMLGLCRGVLADGVVVEKEVRYLNDWINVNPELAVEWPIDVLARRLLKIFEDGKVEESERSDLADLLREITGGKTNVWAGEFAATTLPLDKPPPELSFAGRVYVFTGKFALGPRQVCEDITRQRGAACESRITKRTNYLVIGTFGSSHWAHTSFGRKIMKAAAQREKGGGVLQIVCEDHWAAHLH
jgi:hypothetical protein